MLVYNLDILYCLTLLQSLYVTEEEEEEEEGEGEGEDEDDEVGLDYLNRPLDSVSCMRLLLEVLRN